MMMQCLQMLLFFLIVSPCFVTCAAQLIHVFGYEGGEANVSCPYDAGYKSHEKYLCRNDCGSDDVLITTTKGKKNRFTIRDDINEKVFTTTISNLQYSDAGKYWCGVTRSGILADYYPAEVRLKVEKDTCCDSSTKVQSYEGDSVSIICPYESRYQNNLKYICRGNRLSTCLQQAVVSSTKIQDTRFTLTDDKLSTFTVNITSLTQQDSGSYLCGVHTNTGLDVFSAVDLKVKENTCCDSSTKVQSYEGGSVSITCSYQSRYQNNLKYICRGNRPSTCLQQAVVSSTNKQDTRFTLTDDKLSTFTVNITSLTQQDSGSYLCGVHTNTGLDVFSAVNLEVKENTCCDSSTKVQSYEGGSVSITCPYESRYQNNLKYICRGNRPSTCLQQAVVSSTKIQDTRFTLTDDKLSTFTVNITSLIQQDSGSYLCGVHTNTGLDVFSAVNLEVKENTCCDSSTKVQSYEGGSVSITCPYESRYQNNLKYICRGNHPSTCLQQAVVSSTKIQDTRFTLTDDKLSTFTVNITSLTQQDSGSYLCGVHTNTGLDVFSAVYLEVKDVAAFNTVVFIVPAVLVCVLMFVMVMVCKHKCHRGKETAANVDTTQQQHKAGVPEEVISESEIYENQDVVVFSKQRKSKQQSSCSHYDAGGAQQDLYENFNTSEDIYCNEVYRNVNKR